MCRHGALHLHAKRDWAGVNFKETGKMVWLDFLSFNLRLLTMAGDALVKELAHDHFLWLTGHR